MSKSLSVLVAVCLSCLSLSAWAGGLGPRADGLELAPAQTNPATDSGGGSANLELGMQKRSPVLAGALSLVLPGAGQLYNEEYVVGGIWMASEIALYLGAFAYAGAFTEGEQFSLTWRWEGTLLLAVAAGFHLFSIFDAVTEAARVNADLDKFSVAYDPAHDTFSVGYAFDW